MSVTQSSPGGRKSTATVYPDIASSPTFVLEDARNSARWYILNPDLKWRTVWGVVGDLMVIWSVLTTFYFLAFQGPEHIWSIVDGIVWAFFVVDFFLNMFTRIEDSKGRPVYNLKAITLEYAKNYMLLDLVAILPLRFAGYGDVEYYLRIVRLWKVPAVLNLVDGTGIGMLLLPLIKISSSDNSKTVSLTFKIIGVSFQLLAGIILVTYFLGCTWIWYTTKMKGYPSAANSSFEAELLFHDVDKDWEKLMRAWYYMITTLATIGYGDYVALNPYERLFMIGLQFIGIAAFSFTIGKINTMVNEYNDLVTPQDTTGDMMMWLNLLQARYTKIPLSLRLRIMKHFTHYYSSDHLKSFALSWWNAETVEQLLTPTDEYLAGLEPENVKSVMNYLFEEMFVKYKLFFQTDSDFRYAVAYHLQPRLFPPDEEVIGEDEMTEELYFLIAGTITCGVYDGLSGYTSFLTYNRRTIIGDYSALALCPSPIVYRTDKIAPADMMAIPIKPLQELLNEKFVTVKTKLLKEVARKMHFIQKVISQRTGNSKSLKIQAVLKRLEKVDECLLVAPGSSSERQAELVSFI